MTRRAYVGLTALICAAATIWLLPSASLGRETGLERVDRTLSDATARLGAAVEQAVAPVKSALRSTNAKTKAALQKTKQATSKAGERATRATATDPARQPPLHGANEHGQGGVAVVDLTPSNERPLGGDPDGSDSGEDVVVGRARGEKTGGTYHGHITILALFGTELLGVDSTEGQTKTGPLQPLQESILDPLCASSRGQTCLSVLTANSTSSASGSSNDFALARARILGLGVGAAESGGAISQDANCQTAVGSGRTANVVTAGGQVAAVANSAVGSQSCRGKTSTTTANSQVIQLGGTGIALPVAGCENGTPDSVFDIPLLARIVCNADDLAGAAVVRDALDVFAINAGSTSLVRESTAASEALTVAPAGPEKPGTPQCSDTVDNDGDGVIDANDPGCHTDNNPKNPASYVPSDTSEEDRDDPTPPKNGENGDDPTPPKDGGDGGDGPGVAQAGGPAKLDGDGLPLTGSNVIGLGLAGLLMLAGGLLLRRREEAHPGA